MTPGPDPAATPIPVAPDHAGAIVRASEHVAALDAAVLAEASRITSGDPLRGLAPVTGSAARAAAARPLRLQATREASPTPEAQDRRTSHDRKQHHPAVPRRSSVA